jgi:Tol biopolymer transport system component
MPELLAAGPALDIPTSFWLYGAKLLVNTLNDGHADIGIIDVKSHKREMLLKTPSPNGNAEFSPGGRWILYESVDEYGRAATYVRPFPNVDGGQRPVPTPPAVEACTGLEMERDLFLVLRQD